MERTRHAAEAGRRRYEVPATGPAKRPIGVETVAADPAVSAHWSVHALVLVGTLVLSAFTLLALGRAAGSTFTDRFVLVAIESSLFWVLLVGVDFPPTNRPNRLVRALVGVTLLGAGAAAVAGLSLL